MLQHSSASLDLYLLASFKPHQRGGACCSFEGFENMVEGILMFQTPSAGRWVLQPASMCPSASASRARFKPHQRGGGCCSLRSLLGPWNWLERVSNPISGEEGAAALRLPTSFLKDPSFQTPSAGRWVLQPTSGTIMTVRQLRFKPHQRGGGCCSLL